VRVLVGGAELATLMIEHNLGVITSETYTLKEVSNDFFDENEI
jgi:restriction system protein